MKVALWGDFFVTFFYGVILTEKSMMKTVGILIAWFIALNHAFAQNAPVKVVVKNASGSPISQDKILFVGQKSKKTLSGITNSQGEFLIQLPAAEVYDIKIQGLADEQEYNTLEIPALQPGQYFEEAQLTITYEVPKTVLIGNLHFQTAKADLEPGFEQSLKNLVEVLLRKKDMKIRISGHTDSDGNEQANVSLSQARAEVVRDYLVKKGIAASRIECKGYGSSRPIASNTTAEGKAKNRRTEITIL